jgi:hypothetical protein
MLAFPIIERKKSFVRELERFAAFEFERDKCDLRSNMEVRCKAPVTFKAAGKYLKILRVAEECA